MNFNLFLMGDSHDGSIFRHNEGWDQFVDHVNTSIDGLPIKANKVIDHGDTIEAIDHLDRRFSPETTAKEDLFIDQIDLAVSNRRAIRSNLIGIHIGNHELAKLRMGNAAKKVAKELGVRYLAFRAVTTFKTTSGNLIFKHFSTHGKKPINSRATDPKVRRTNKQIQLKDRLRDKHGSCISMSRGHTHWLDRLPPERDIYLTDDGDKSFYQWTQADHTAEFIPPDLRWYVSTGSFLKNGLTNSGVISYSEVADYNPTLWMGFMLCKIRNGKITEIEPVVLD